MRDRDVSAALVRAALEGPAPAALLDDSLRFVCVNEPWRRFAESGGARADHPSWAVGASYVDAISGPLRGWYERALRALLGSTEAWHHDYECSSPELERSFRLTAYPQTAPQRGILLVHTCRVERPHPHEGASVDAYRDAHGIVHACMHCGRARRLDGNGWDWVPAAIGAERTSHGLCQPCSVHYFGVP